MRKYRKWFIGIAAIAATTGCVSGRSDGATEYQRLGEGRCARRAVRSASDDQLCRSAAGAGNGEVKMRNLRVEVENYHTSTP